MRIGTLFGGAGGWDIGALLAGADPVWSIEREPSIAAVQKAYLSSRVPWHQVVVEDVTRAKQLDLGSIDVLLASPVCKSHSQGTSRMDGDLCEHAWTGQVVPDYARIYRPKFVVVENVAPYQRHASFRSIVDGLEELGYEMRLRVYGFHRHGLPQSRIRMLAWFQLGKNRIDELLEPRPSVSWLEATEDLLADLPPSKLAPWQIARIERMKSRSRVGPFPWLVSSFNVSTTKFNQGETVVVGRYADEPAWTVVASKRAQSALRVLDEDGSVKLASLRMLARFQGFPDDWEIPQKASLATETIGNAVPPMISAQVIETLQRYG